MTRSSTMRPIRSVLVWLLLTHTAVAAADSTIVVQQEETNRGSLRRNSQINNSNKPRHEEEGGGMSSSMGVVGDSEEQHVEDTVLDKTTTTTTTTTTEEEDCEDKLFDTIAMQQQQQQQQHEEDTRNLNRLFNNGQGGGGGGSGGAGGSDAQVSPAESAILLAANPFSHTHAGGSSSSNSNSNNGSSNNTINAGDARIVGGTYAGSTEFPYFVQGRGCGASLVWYDVALTAGHCLGTPWNSGVVIGSTVRDSSGTTGISRTVVQQVRHPNFNANNMFNDYLVLKLSSEVPRTGRIQPVALNSVTSVPASDNAPLTIVGYGVTAEGATTQPTNLKKATVYSVSQSTCASKYGSGINSNLMLCAAAAGTDTCQGDSGGPILDASGVQVGVTSFGFGCARAGIPGVYARTSGAYSWIREQICALSSSPPSYCTSGGNSGGTLYTVTLTLKADKYPSETSWTLKNSAGQVKASQSTSSVTQQSALVQRSVSLPAGTYTLSFRDAYGDGFCCQYGNGYFMVKVNGVTAIQRMGNFGYALTTSFRVGGSSRSSSSSSLSANTKSSSSSSSSVARTTTEYRIDVQYDNAPDQFRWSIFRKSTQSLVAQAPLGAAVSPGELQSTVVDLVPTESYELRLFDTRGNGICCQQGKGYVDVYAVVNGIDQQPSLAFSNGQFGATAVIPFTVPAVVANSTSSSNGNGNNKKNNRERLVEEQQDEVEEEGDEDWPLVSAWSSTKTCTDSVSDTFDVNADVGAQTCSWLVNNLDNYNYLCALVKVALKCPQTCAICDML